MIVKQVEGAGCRGELASGERCWRGKDDQKCMSRDWIRGGGYGSDCAWTGDVEDVDL
jgi:hypothetical protein